MRTLFMTTALAASLLAGAASAQTMATASTDLNVRSGPANSDAVVGVIGSGDEVAVSGCIESANWCQVTSGTLTGWAYGDYLTTKVGDKIEPIYPNRQSIGIAVIEAPAAGAIATTGATATAGTNAAAGGATGATMGAVVGGPVGALVGAAIGGTAGAAATPDPTIQTYIVANPRDPVYLDGEVVVGAGVPDNVDLYEIPEQPDYRYVTINGQPVLVSPTDRRIVYIYR